MTKRRDFIKKSVAGTGAIAIGGMGLSAKSYASIIGANDRIMLGQIGVRNQGTVHINSWCGLKDSHNVRVKTICDVDEALWGPAVKTITDKTGVKPLTEWDMHKVFEDKEIDAVSIVIPNHWHALATIWALQAGKHVYIEKPCSHNIWEGRKMVEAARKYDKRVQCGLNNRSSSNVREAIKFIHDGGIGEVFMARALCYKARDSYGYAKDSLPPATFHYDRWLGPAPWRPYNEKRSHYAWHWYWDTGNGDSGNTGPHQLDLARWGMSKNEHPVTVYSTGGLYGLKKEPSEADNKPYKVYGDVMAYGDGMTTQETPNTQTVAYKYEDGKMLEFEVRGRYTNHEGNDGKEVGNLFYGTEGWLQISNDTWRAFRQRERTQFAGSKERQGPDFYGGNHWANFLEALRSNKSEDLNGEINEGFMSTCLPLLANISYRVGRELKFMGAYEKFVNDPEADMMLSREYRKPYIVPDEV
jgi:predicted dehydrogenase